MRRRLYIPEEVKQDIREHLGRALAHAEQGYVSAHEDEDAVTGDLGSALRSGVRRVLVAQSEAEIPGEWKWAITYYKFRGKGKGAAEASLGADGIFELDLISGSRHDQKSLLFQAKVSGEGGRRLLEQALKLTTWREAAFVLVYSPSGYRAVSLDDVIRARGAVDGSGGLPLPQYLGSDFLDCDVGDDEIRYDAHRKQLIWRAMNGEVVGVTFVAKHRLTFRIEAPRHGEDLPSIDRLVPADRIHDFRMQATEEEVLSLKGRTDAEAVKKARNQLALTYHPDRVNELDELYRAIMNRRMQEANVAADRLKRK